MWRWLYGSAEELSESDLKEEQSGSEHEKYLKEEEESQKQSSNSEVLEEEVKLSIKMTNLDRLVHKRGQVKAKVTRLRDQLKKMETDLKLTSLAELRVCAKNLERYYSEFDEVQSEVLNECEAADVDKHDRKYEEFEVLFNDTSLAIERLQEKLTPQPNQAVVPAQVNGQQQQVIVQQQALRAPLPTFDGRYENWPRFKAMF